MTGKPWSCSMHDDPLGTLLQLIHKHNGINNKARLATLVSKTFGLTIAELKSQSLQPRQTS